ISCLRFWTWLITGKKSSFMVQQIQPFGKSWISTPHSSPAARNNAPSTETSPNSFTSTAKRRLGFFFSNPLIKVVLPEPKKPVTIVTGIFIVRFSQGVRFLFSRTNVHGGRRGY